MATIPVRKRAAKPKQDDKLLPQHRALLVASAISNDVAGMRSGTSTRPRRYESVSPGLLTLPMYGFSDKVGSNTPGLLIRLFGTDGEVWGYQYRPDNPRKKTGPKTGTSTTEVVKYESPHGQAIHLDVPQLTREWLEDKNKAIIVTEGSRKADAAVSAGYCAIALIGVTMWRCPDWKMFPLSGREVYIAFDSDAVTKSEVQTQEQRLASFLSEMGAVVKLCRLEPAEDGAKVGLDDYIAANGDVDWLLAEAVPTKVKKAQPDDDKREQLDVSNAADLAEFLRDNMGTGPLTGLYKYGQMIVRIPLIGEQGYEEPKLNDRGEAIDGPAIIDPIDSGILRASIGGLGKIDIPKPTRRDAMAARDVILDLLQDFMFVSEADKANYLGLMLTPFLRHASGPPWPLGIFTAPAHASGKTLLSILLKKIHGGVTRSEMADDDAEMRKSITAILATTTAPVVVWDNVTRPVKSSQLDSLLTLERGGMWNDRYLGQTKEIQFPANRLWIVTGNNVVTRGTIPRRTIWVRLNTRLSHPERREDFKYPELAETVGERRSEVIAALLTIVRSYAVEIMAGRLKLNDKHGKVGFRYWSSRIDAMLRNIEIEDFWSADTEPDQRDDPEFAQWEDWLLALHAAYEGSRFTVGDVVGKLDASKMARRRAEGEEAQLVPAAMPTELIEKYDKLDSHAFAQTLGLWFMNRADRFYGRFAISSPGMQKTAKVREWHLVVGTDDAE